MSNPTLSITVFILVLTAGRLYLRTRVSKRIPDDIDAVRGRMHEAEHRLHRELARHV